jgi:predicted RNase H-like nuclease (RuvC/YqgF family)
MLDFETSLSGIEFKTRQLSDEVNRLRQLLEQSQQRCNSLQEALNNKETVINNLIEENKIVKLGNRLSDKNDSAEVKKKINEMIRAIDKSIQIIKGNGNGIGIG